MDEYGQDDTPRHDVRDDEELRRTREAQEAHGGSMAPGLVDATGHQVADPPPTGDSG